eukprot:COSAG01_NODE_70_length_28755_cov_34.709067_3_plen_132_part_00
MLRQAPGTLAVRLHGSKRTQDLLKEVQGAEQMRVLADGSLPPVLVLTNQSTGKANNSQCADYILTVSYAGSPSDMNGLTLKCMNCETPEPCIMRSWPDDGTGTAVSAAASAGAREAESAQTTVVTSLGGVD